jgi:glycosyltransferase involved in cell wall biosynthesis
MTGSQGRLGFFLPTLQAGGTERTFVNLAVDFFAAGYTVDIVLKDKKGEFLAELPPGIQVLDLKASRMIAAIPGLTCYIRAEKPHALISGLELPNLILVLSKMLARSHSRTIVTIRSMVSKHHRYFLPTRSLERLAMRSIYPLADYMVAVSNRAAQDFSNYVGVTGEKIKVIYNPVLTPQFYHKAGEELEHPWFTPGSPPVILGVGRLSQVKDFATLIRAFELVQKQLAARLLILGEGPQRVEMESLIAQFGLDSVIQLPGFEPNPYPYFRKSAVFVLSSLYDASPNVLVEALACGCPVVSTACPGGAAELIGYGKYGQLTPVGDHQVMAEAVLHVLRGAPRPSDVHPGLTEWLGNFTSETAFRKYLQLIEGGS